MTMSRRATAVLLLTISACSTAREAPSAPPGSRDTTADPVVLLERALEVTGGVSAWQAVRTMDFDLEATLFMPEGEVAATSRILFRMPDEMYRGNVLAGVGEINMLIRGDDAWFQAPGEPSLAPATPGVAEYLKSGLWRDLAYLFARGARTELERPEVRWLREERADGEVYHVLRIEPPHELPAYELYLDAASGVPVKRAFMQGEDEIVDVFAEFQEHGGLKLPRAVRSYRNGVLAEDIVYTGIRINTPLPERFFSVE